MKINGPEACDAQRLEAVLTMPLLHYLADSADRFVGRSGRHSLACDDVRWPTRQNGDALCPAKLDAGEQRTVAQAAVLASWAAQQLSIYCWCEGSSFNRCMIACRILASVRSRSSSDIVSAIG